ncbi:Cyclic di-GMP phosphodiesterase Gmr [Hartmannibacter diazotrophicus]|uniref:Cyclic di-GMP phosphodiesterase Gmr n=2 Tax=Hartmannibacter diazotrophicus TaxID=1482074 RepID=A0A2C9DBJ7_9HYPH|nr:Cyclic di-GMP phosphodiesterase Gmr [Hartmannibacter diazotrophicus]
MTRVHLLLGRTRQMQLVAGVFAVLSLVLFGAEMSTSPDGGVLPHGWGLFACALLVSSFFPLLGGFLFVGRLSGHIEEREEERDRLINVDHLTGALTRRKFIGILDARLQDIRSAQMKGRPSSEFALLLIDVDHFKHINDAFGHAAGDLMLRRIVDCARRQVGWTIGRLGGDEFAAIVEATDYWRLLSDINDFMDRCRAAMALNEQTRGYQGLSIGVALAPKDANLSDTLLQFADIALYAGKRNGRGQVTLFNKEMQKEQIELRKDARDLRAAIILDRLDVHYQPIVGKDGQAIGAEALVRWPDPFRGPTSPGHFVPVAEQTGLIDALGEWVFRRVCHDFTAADYPTIFVNISGEQLKGEELIPMLKSALRESGRSAENFVLEITETVILNASDNILQKVKEMREIGFRIALDDFGTGNSSFAVLRELPVDIVKIDKSYIQTLENDPTAQVFVAAVNQIGNLLGFKVLAEGIETDEQSKLARLAGLVMFQGYHFGRPRPLVATDWKKVLRFAE